MSSIINDVVSGVIMLGIGLVVEMIRQQNKKNNAEIKQQLKDNLEQSKNDFKKLYIEIARVRIMTLIYDDPTSHNEILDLFDEYEKMGGNGSTKQRVHDWKQREGID